MSPTKVVGRRSAAAIIDVIPGFIVYWGAVRALGDHIGTESGTQITMRTEVINGDLTAQLGGDVYALESGTFMLVTLIAMAYWIGVYVIWQGTTGATIGKTVMGIRTVGADGRPCGLGKAALRWLLLLVDGFPYIAPLIGFITALSTEGNRRIGDMAAKTFVVRATSAGQPVSVGQATGVPVGAYVPRGAVPPNSAPPGGASASGAPGPQWDAARNTYIRWEPNEQAWYQWDSPTNQWKPIDS